MNLLRIQKNIDGERFVGMPRIMGDFRRVARTCASVRELFGEPKSQQIGKAVFGVHVGAIPSLEELLRPLLLLETSIPLLGCLSEELIRDLVESAKKIPHQENCCNLEEQSNNHLHNFVCNHTATANRSLCDVWNNYSSKLSVSLALRLLSPRQVYHYVRQQQDKVKKAEDLNWMPRPWDKQDELAPEQGEYSHTAGGQRRHPGNVGEDTMAAGHDLVRRGLRTKNKQG
jgi:hypothetical protein